MTHSKNCILANLCRNRDTVTCTPMCEHFVLMHGKSGTGGRIGAAEVPRDYALLTAVNSPVRDDQPSVYKTIDAYIQTFLRQFETSGERIKSLYLYSESPGTGKTTTASVILNEYVIRHYLEGTKRRQPIHQRPGLFLDVNEWQTLYNTFNRPKVPDFIAEPASRRYYELMKMAQVVPFVVLDDIGVRQPTEGFRSDLHTIINARVMNQLPTIYTSNIPIDELSSVFNELRLADRIKDQCLQLNFVGTSKRGIRK